MDRAQLEYLHSELRNLERQLRRNGAPGTIAARANDALLSVEWLMNNQKFTVS